MKAIDSLTEIERDFVLTIGNFDGVHKGHQDVIDHLKTYSKSNSCAIALVCFVPHPLRVLNPSDNFLINDYLERRELLRDLGVDYICELEFTRDFSTLSPEDFLNNFILNNSKLKKIYVGYDFGFGANKSGSYETFMNICKNRNLSIEKLDEYRCSNEKISSSEVRKLLRSGEVEKVTEFLNRQFFISGRVIKGDGRGKKIGFPTANLNYAQARIIPARGVYISWVEIGERKYQSVTNIGLNPTFGERTDLRVESHLIDFDEDIYGEKIKVTFIKKLRNERKFNSVNELISQIEIDVKNAREFFRESPN